MAVHSLLALTSGTPLRGGDYVVDACLGQGGFGITYQARDSRLYRRVAIKEFFPVECRRSGAAVAPGGSWTVETLERFQQRFLDEGRALARLRHPGIVVVYDVFPENRTVYLVMELLEGETLQEILDRRGPLPVGEALSMVRQAGEALSAVHATGLLHRDLKPSNIVRRTDGQVVLIDFGAAREFAVGETLSHTVMHTPGYAPVEQYARHGRRGPFTDVYALAATLYHMLTGEPPLDARVRAVEDALPPPHELTPEIPVEVSGAVMRGLRLRAEERPATVAEFVASFGSIEPPRIRLETGRIAVPGGALAWVAYADTSRGAGVRVDPELGLVALVIGAGREATRARDVALEALSGFVRKSHAEGEITWPFGLDVNMSFEGNRLSTALKLANKRLRRPARDEVPMDATAGAVAALFEGANVTAGSAGGALAFIVREGLREPFPLARNFDVGLGVKDEVVVDARDEELQSDDVLLLASEGLVLAVGAEALARAFTGSASLERAVETVVAAAQPHANRPLALVALRR